MSINISTLTDRADKPLIREDVIRLLQEIGNSKKLNLTRKNLASIDLSNLNLRGANLSEVDLTRADLSNAVLIGTNLSSANLSFANLIDADLSNTNLSEANLSMSYLNWANLSGANLNGTKLWNTILTGTILTGTILDLSYLAKTFFAAVPTSSSEDTRPFNIKIIEEPLTTQNFSMILSNLTELHTKCWLIAQQRLGDLIEYSQTHNLRFTEEANLVIEKLTYNSPADIKFNMDASPQSVAEALKTGIDAITLASHRYKAAELEIQAREQELKQKELESLAALKREEQNRQIEADKAEMEKQKTLMEIEKQQIEIERQQLNLQKEHLEMQTQRINVALETGDKMIDMLYPGVDSATKAMLLQTLLPNLLQLGAGKGLELVTLPITRMNSKEKSTS